jgi:predicted nucleic acid-binding protein
VIVVDSSALIGALAASPPARDLLHRIDSADSLHAPHLVDLEFLQAVRRLVATGAMSADSAEDARLDFSLLAINRYPHFPLADRIWELRENLTAYDAAFVALSEALRMPLVTADARIASAPGHGAAVELFTS